jgi:hypothetical protein
MIVEAQTPVGLPSAAGYVSRLYSAEEVYPRMVKRYTSSSLYYAGQIALQEAFFATEDNQDFWFGRFQLAADEAYRLNDHVGYAIKAGVMIKQAPLFKHLQTDKMPPRDLALCVYSDTVDYAAKLVERRAALAQKATEQRLDQVEYLRMYRGITAELAADLLFARYPLTNNNDGVSTENWFPFFALISEQMSKQDNGEGKMNFDLKILTDTQGWMMTGKRVQVQLSKNHTDQYDPGINVVTVKEDLALKPREKDVDFRIIRGCYRELHDMDTSSVSHALDLRTVKALRRLDIAS